MKKLFLALAVCLGFCNFAYGQFSGNHEIFVRGDANNDGSVNNADVSYITNWLHLGGPPPLCDDATDANDDGSLGSADASYIANWYFLDGPPPAAPGPFACGEDPSEDDLGCDENVCDE